MSTLATAPTIAARTATAETSEDVRQHPSAPPPPPREPRSFFVPIAAVIVGLSGAFAVPAFSAASHQEVAPAEPEPSPVAVEVQTTPEGATVRVGDESCTSPCSLDLLPGDAQLAIELDHHRSLREEIDVQEGMDSLSFELAKKPFQLTVNAPEGAEIVVGETAATAGEALTLDDLDSSVLVRVSQRGFRPFEQEVSAGDFEEGEEFRSLSLEAELTRRVVRRRPATSEPSGPVPSNPF